jgi:hypothetical protein
MKCRMVPRPRQRWRSWSGRSLAGGIRRVNGQNLAPDSCCTFWGARILGLSPSRSLVSPGLPASGPRRSAAPRAALSLSPVARSVSFSQQSLGRGPAARVPSLVCVGQRLRLSRREAARVRASRRSGETRRRGPITAVPVFPRLPKSRLGSPRPRPRIM